MRNPSSRESKVKQQQSKQANTLKKGQTEIPNYMPIYTDIYIYIKYITYYIHEHAYIGEYSIKTFVCIFLHFARLLLPKKKQNPKNSNQILTHTIWYDKHTYIYMLRSVAHWANNDLVIDKKKEKQTQREQK